MATARSARPCWKRACWTSSLWIHPVVVGNGTLWFREGERVELELVMTDTTKTGVVIATYRPTQP